MRKMILLPLLLIGLIACSPSKGDCEEAITRYYEEVSRMPGAGSHKVGKIEVLHVEKDSIPGQWIVKAKVQATVSNYALPTPQEPREENITRSFMMEKTQGGGVKVSKVR